MRKDALVGYSIDRRQRFNPWIIAVIIFLVFLLWLVVFGLEQKKLPEKKKNTTTSTTSTTITSVTSTISATSTTQAKPAAQPKNTRPINGIKILNQQTCRGIESGVPQGAGQQFPANSRVYYYTVIESETLPVGVSHVWVSPANEVYASIPLTISRQPHVTWSYISLPPESQGEWTVKIVAADKTIDQLEFMVQ